MYRDRYGNTAHDLRRFARGYLTDALAIARMGERQFAEACLADAKQATRDAHRLTAMDRIASDARQLAEKAAKMGVTLTWQVS